MGAPTPTARGTPAGIRIDDGFSTKITFGSKPTLSVWEKTVKPPGVDGGDAINATTMHSAVWRTMRPRHLKTMTDCQATVAYDPSVMSDIRDQCNVEQVFTLTFPDGSTDAFYGYMKSFEPSNNSEGEQPEATITIIVTNYDATVHAEQGPVFGSVAGT
jgi:hypothetical protein